MKLLIAYFKDTEKIGKKVAKTLNAKSCLINVKTFPDSEFNLQIKEDPRDTNVVIISSMGLNPNEKIIETIFAGGIARDFGANKVILVATYLPYMRQDKHFLFYDSFSALHLMEIFSKFDKIIVIDPHLHRIKSLRKVFNKSKCITSVPLIAEYIKKRFKGDFIIVGPDEESLQWSEKVARVLKKKVVILKKTRFDSEKVRLEKKELGKNIVVIDDIVSTGHTMEEVLKMAKNQGAKKITCIAIHGLLVKDADKRIRKYAELITTNTVPNKYAKIDVSPIIIKEINSLV